MIMVNICAHINITENKITSKLQILIFDLSKSHTHTKQNMTRLVTSVKLFQTI